MANPTTPSSDPHDSDDFEDVSGGEEDVSDYCKGGYHAVRLQDQFKDGRYTVVRKLGWGHFSTVWLARDGERDRYVALKVVKSAKNYTEAAQDEIQLCDKVARTDPTAPGHLHVVELLDHFMHYGPNGAHVCMVFEVLGENLLSLIRRYRKRGGLPVPLVKDVARQILLGLDYMHEACRVIHTDMKPENVLVAIPNVEVMIRQQLGLAPTPAVTSDEAAPAESLTNLPRARVVEAPAPAAPAAQVSSSSQRFTGAGPQGPGNGFSFGGQPPASTTAATATNPTVTTTEVLERTLDDITISGLNSAKADEANRRPASPQITVSQELSANPALLPPLTDSPADAARTMGDEGTRASDHARTAAAQAVADSFIQVKIADLGNACWVHKHFTEDIQTRQYRSPEVILGAKWGPTADVWSLACMVFELITGEFLFQPRSGKKYDKDDDHLALMIETLGPFPRALALAGKYSRDYFNRSGQLRHISRLRPQSIAERLIDEFGWSKLDAEELEGFLTPMLHLNPDRRARARDMLNHGWLRQPSL
ncbi:serine/threonine protein kinase, CMGC [Tieghemiomyces parasiticus]|uniref:non-specific serine/threonine protein kinase n=1 Tax=Tieghemiomyces parasiticus TaxID=78921 RepID=A0A9W8AGI5_9FUNG|nr:serine/threonine protein kinase, CMGC [Tieghemiomyces parasiticus]